MVDRRAALWLSGPVVAFSLGALTGCGGQTATGTVGGDAVIDAGPGTGVSLAITGATVVPMDAERRLPGHTVLVADGLIQAVAPDGAVEIPAGARIVEADGRSLLPGLADMHVHMSRADAPLYPAAGVTTVRNLWGFVELAPIVADIESGALVGPTIHTVSPGLDGTPPKWPQTQLVTDPSQTAAVVDAQIAAGYRALKLYQDLRSDVFDAIIHVARDRSVPFLGHVPHRVGLERALDAGYRSIEHLSGYGIYLAGGGSPAFPTWAAADVSRMPEIAARTAAAGVWNCPTLAIALEILGEEPGSDAAFAENRRRMVAALHDAGAGLLVGTDAGIGRTAPGSSIHDELEELVAAGLTPNEALRAATVDAASFLGVPDEFGRVATGLRADLLLLDGDPLQDISVTRRRAGVVLRGVWRRSGS